LQRTCGGHVDERVERLDALRLGRCSGRVDARDQERQQLAARPGQHRAQLRRGAVRRLVAQQVQRALLRRESSMENPLNE
jgi:hypothetical protein